LGTNLTGATGVTFNGVEATAFTVVSRSLITATVPADATTGFVTVTTPGGTLTSNQPFRVTPVVLSFSPTSGPAGTPVTITGDSLTQTTKVAFGGMEATFTVDSDTQLTATVPTGAVTGDIVIQTLGGKAWTPSFTVTP
jgi:large repetitive protein